MLARKRQSLSNYRRYTTSPRPHYKFTVTVPNKELNMLAANRQSWSKCESSATSPRLLYKSTVQKRNVSKNIGREAAEFV